MERPSDLPNSQASDSATVLAPTPPRAPSTAQLTCGRSTAPPSGTLGAEKIAWAWARVSRSASGEKGLSR